LARMPFNLLTDPFFPVATRGGYRRWVGFPELAATDGDFPVDFDWPRTDLNMAAYEFAIGVATVAFQPQRRSDWLRLWHKPPLPDVVRDAVAPFAHAFNLDGDGPLFLQELGGVEGEPTPIEALLIDTPGANGQKKNADLLTHRQRYEALGPPAAAIALYALQQFAPAGGAGNRTSMRGGGPLTTLVIPGAPDGERVPLWRVVLANLNEDETNETDTDDLPRIFPWLAPTIVSDKAHGERKIDQSAQEAHPLQAFFGMPRRIALRFEGEGLCSMTGENGPRVSGFAQRPWGMNYGQWLHPLTPYRRQKEDTERFSFKPKSGRLGYRDWVAVTVGAKDAVLASPAAAVGAARGERSQYLRGGNADPLLRAGGWAMNNMEAIGYLFAEQPLHLAPNYETQILIDETARKFAKAADEVAGMLRHAIRNALFSARAKPSTDSGVFEETRSHFYESTEDAFHDTLDALTQVKSGDGRNTLEELSRKWLPEIARAASTAFDRGAPVPIDDPERAQRIAAAFRALRSGLAGYGKPGAALFEALGLAVSEARSGAKKEGRNGR
jgi:CRISPR system Cascade subunit CasA